MTNFVKNFVTELPKSPLPAGYATESAGFAFFVSGPKPLECDKYIIDGEAIVLSTGGNAAVHYGKGKFSYSTDCWALQPVKNDIEGKYLYYFLCSQIDRIDALGFEGSGLKHLRKDFIRNYEVPDLSKPEQSKIAEVLSKVDQAIEQTEGLIAKQQRIKTGLMQDLLTRGIDEHGSLRSEETHEFKDSPLGRIPVEWEVGKLSDYILFIRSGLSRRIVDKDIGVPVITSTNIQNGVLNIDQLSYWYLKDPKGANTERYLLDDKDILLNFINSFERIGKVCMYKDIGRPTIYTTNIFRIKCCKNSIQEFLFNLLESQIVQNEIKLITKPAVNQASFTTGDFLRIPVPMIKKVEQARIVQSLLKIDKHHRETKLRFSKLRSLKTALMQDLLTGKVRVTPLLEKKEACS